MTLTCVRCGATAQTVISTTEHEHERPTSQLYCDACWRLIREKAGLVPVMLEGPVIWGESWDEVEAWLMRTLAVNPSDAYRHLIAYEIRRQAPHMSGPIPPSVGSFLIEFGEASD